MRGPIVLLLLVFSAFPVLAQEPDLDFAVTMDDTRLDLGTLAFEVSIPADELTFVESGDELVAMYSIRSGTRVLEPSQRVTAPRNTRPVGMLTRRYEMHVTPATTSVEIIVRDENAKIEATRTILIEGATARVEEDVANDTVWHDALARAAREKKPIVVFYSTRPCSRCRRFARAIVPHPGIQRRLPNVVFATLPAPTGEEASVAFFDRRGVLRARWRIVPDGTDFGTILDSVIAVAPDFERAAEFAETGQTGDAELAAANGLARMGRVAEARDALARAEASTNAETRQNAIIMRAILDAREGKRAAAMDALDKVAAEPASEKIAAGATATLASMRRRAPLTYVVPDAVRVLPLSRQAVRGRQLVRTHVGSPFVARVAFLVDGREVARVAQPPFSATVDFGDVPQRHSVVAVAFDRRDQEIGRDERIVNDAGETFSLHIVTPREGPAIGAVRVSMNLRVPPAEPLQRVTVSWNDARRAVLQAPPWETTIRIPEGEVGVLRALAELEDGRTSEDAVLLNAGGAAGHADVQLVELPMTIAGGNGAITPDRIVVREGNKTRRVESIATADETPLTIGLLIDVSSSMQASLLDVQEAAIGFLESTLGPRDRAFVITFDTRARIVQPATSDAAQLRKQIMTLRPDGLTAIHDAMVLGLLQFEGVKGRRAMVVFTDGLDITSEYKAPDVRELARRVAVPIHVIASTPGVAARLQSSSAPSKSAPPSAELSSIARTTGGSAQSLDDLGQLPRLYAHIEAALRAQFLAFVRTDPATRENEWRPIQVRVQGSEVFAPEGYYAVR